jgi:hypothetical protein
MKAMMLHVLTEYHPTIRKYVEFEVFTVVAMKSAVFWDVVLCRSCVNRRFGRRYRLHLQGRKIRERETSLSRWLAVWNV